MEPKGLLIPKMAWGNVTAYGTKSPTIAGSGATILRDEQGIYYIDFQVKFTNIPAFVATQQYSANDKWDDTSSKGGDTRDNVTIIALSATHAKVKTGDSGGNAQDRNFSFIAIGN